jgi:U3 small nucleolar RNA-associated protein MPP10
MAGGSEALNSVKATDPTQWLAPSPALSQSARAALQNLFSSIRPFTPKSPFDQLLVDGFDAEQIWQQIDIQSQPLISSLRRELKRYEKNPDEIKTLKVVVQGQEKVLEAEKEEFDEELEESDDGEEEEDDDDDDDEENEEEVEEEEEEEEEEKEEEQGGGNNEIEDPFFNLKDLGKYLKATEAEEYKNDKDDKEDEEEDDEDEDEEDDDQEVRLCLSLFWNGLFIWFLV